MNDPELPVTRWELADHSAYGRRFAKLLADGEDIEGEARLADVLAPRGARILDAGSGMGRVADGLVRRGHQVTAVEKDPDLVAQSRKTFPEVTVVESDILALTPAILEARRRPSSYDLVVAVGNVMVLLAEGTERRALRTLGSLLTPEGRMLVGFRLVGGPQNAHTYPAGDFVADVEAVGLCVQHRFDGYDLASTDDEYAVWVLSRTS
ncbi:MAG: methyltransferase domain-containing protein [Actinomycetota bacterium]|nr:methyltransferase domain-containing protein [Actinomycetota bacterium]